MGETVDGVVNDRLSQVRDDGTHCKNNSDKQRLQQQVNGMDNGAVLARMFMALVHTNCTMCLAQSL